MRRTRFNAFSLKLLLVSSLVMTGTAVGISTSASATDATSVTAVQGTNGSGTPGMLPSSGGVTPDVPVGYCATGWSGGTQGYANFVFSAGQCSVPMVNISVTSILLSKGTQVATKNASKPNALYESAQATKSCSNSGTCLAGDPYSGQDQQYFLASTTWSGSTLSCFISGTSMICSGFVPPWNW